MAIRIFIDQGHNPPGQPNAGAVANGLYESDINWDVGNRLRQLLEADERFEVMVSRETPQTVLGTSNATSLAARVNMANAWPADYFISIHGNANTNPAINGTEAYVYSMAGEAYVLGDYLVRSITETVGTKPNGVHINTGLYVLRTTQMPAVLVELAYLTNTGDAAILREDPQGFAQGIYTGLLSYFGLI